MGKIIPLRNPGNYRRAHQRIRALWEEREVINHAKRRMQERGFDMTYIEHAIRSGRVTDHSKPHAWWRYVLDVRSVDGRPMRVVVEIDGRLIIVTVVRR